MAPCCDDDDCGDGICDYFVDDSGTLRRQCFPSYVVALMVPVSVDHPGTYFPCCSDINCGGGKCQPVEDSTYSATASLAAPFFEVVSTVAMRCVP